MTDPEPPCPFGVAVVAACGLDAPGLADTLERVLLRLTSKHRHRPIVVTTVMFQAVSRAAGMSQPVLAENAKLPLATLRQYEQGRRARVPFNAVVALARALGVSCDAIAGCLDVTPVEEPPKPIAKRKKP